MGLLNKFLGIVSGISGIGFIVGGIHFADVSTGLSGFGAVAMAVVLFQLTDLRERIKAIEACLLHNPNTKGKSAGR